MDGGSDFFAESGSGGVGFGAGAKGGRAADGVFGGGGSGFGGPPVGVEFDWDGGSHELVDCGFVWLGAVRALVSEFVGESVDLQLAEIVMGIVGGLGIVQFGFAAVGDFFGNFLLPIGAVANPPRSGSPFSHEENDHEKPKDQE